MDQPKRERIADDLRGIIKGDLLFDDLSRTFYSTDASIFQIEPLGVVLPRDEEDVRVLVRYAAEHQLSLVPRGAGTGLAGEALGKGLIVDFSRYFRAICDLKGDTVRVQPGVVYRELNAQLAKVGRRFAPDPASGEQCTIGGMVANNASGAQTIRYGYTRDYVSEMRVVLDTGEATVAGLCSRWPSADVQPGRREDIVASVITLLEQNADTIQQGQPRTPFNRCGYLLDNVLTARHLDLARLLVGSEGTLAIFTEATLRTIPLPAGRSIALLGFDSLDSACQAAQRVSGSVKKGDRASIPAPAGPAACELIDRRLLTLARGSDTDFSDLVPPATEAVLLIEFEADTQAEARECARELVDHLHRTDRLAIQARLALEPAEMDRLWGLREAALPSLYALRGGAQPIAFIEDVGVPPQELLRYLHGVQDILQKHETTASFLVHACTGQVHTRPFLDLRRPEEVSKLWQIADEVYNLVLGLGGTISAQHGTGLARTPWVSRQYGKLYTVFRELKAIFDPQHIFNPGKIIGPDPDMPAWPLRPLGSLERARPEKEEPSLCAPSSIPDLSAGTPATTQHPSSHLLWQPGELATQVISCNGCGQCRGKSPSERMCPIFRAQHVEAASPRAKANLMRHVLTNLATQPADGKALSSSEVRAIADLCVNCKMCARECPAHVNIPKLMLEAKAANVMEHGLSRSDWAMARTEMFARLGSDFAMLANLTLGSRTARWFLEKFFGVSRKRRLPTFALRNFLRRAERRGWTRKPRVGRGLSTPPHGDNSTLRIAYFVDIYANYNAPQIAEAVAAVLLHQGIPVYVPPKQLGCGMASLAYGDVETARETVEHNLHILADLAREGYTILCSEPTAALMLRQDTLNLLDDADARLVSERVVEFTAFLWDLHKQGRLKTDFQSLDFAIGHHVPCHLKALGEPAAGPRLLSLIPGLKVHIIDVSCSGMAGTFGLKSENYELSREAGRPMLEALAHPRVLFGSTECSPCRMQMEDGTRKRTLHPAEYLALAYGLMPDVAGRLREPIRELVL